MGEWVKFPTTAEELKEVCKRIEMCIRDSRMTERMDDRALRLKTLGNAVCPPQAYPCLLYTSRCV